MPARATDALPEDHPGLGFVDHAVARAVPLADGTFVDRISKRFKLTA